MGFGSLTILSICAMLKEFALVMIVLEPVIFNRIPDVSTLRLLG